MKKSLILLALLTFGFNKMVLSQVLSDSVQLSEVIVSAEKKNQKINELPISVTSIGISRIEAEKAKSLRNISAIVPNFYMPEYGSKLTAPVFIRGVGSRINSPSIGLYIDRVPYFEKSAFAFDFSDVERIEILRGPQGTLYGRNTLGGIINVITRAPRNYRELRLNTDFGNYGYMKYNFSYNEPVTSKFAVLLNGGYTERDGYFTNEYYHENVGNDYTKNASLKLRYNPLKQLVLTYKFGGERSYEKGYPYGVLDSTDEVKVINYNYKSRYKRDLIDNSLTASLYLDKFVLTSVSAYQFLKDKQEIDQDFTPKDYYQVQQGVDQDQFTQEIVISTNESKWIDATGGVFAFIQKADRDIDLNYGADGKEVKLVPGNGYVKYNNEDNSGIAAFGQFTLKKLLGFIDLTFGLRYDYEWNKLHFLHYTTKAEVPTLFRDTVFKNSFNELLPKVSMRFNLTSNTSAYFTTSKGYRGGGFNITYVNKEDEIYKPEKTWNYEVGIKSSPLPMLSVSAAAFYIDWDNQQVSQRVSVGGNMYKNAGKTYSRGVEFELILKPLKDLQLGGNFGYTQARYVDFQPSIQDELNYKDKYLPFVPRNTYSLFAGYKIDLNTGVFQSAYANFSINGIGKQYWDDANTRSQEAYSIVNGTIGIQSKRGSLSLWMKNLFNTDYSPYAFYVSNFKNWYAQKGQPFTCGISISVNIAGKE
ncbi:MAG TPA: TonB-dependent receptor [Bacteroidales bacterium]|nr:TonB-dependent receptor [Bacteroidales bacterium]